MAKMAILKEFNLRYPGFQNPPLTEPPTPSYTDAQIRNFLEWSEEYLCPNAWGSNFREAVMLLTAVKLSELTFGALNPPGSTSATMGAVASASVGGESVSYGYRGRNNVRSFDEWLLMYPPYGQSFLALRDSSMAGVAETRTGYGRLDRGNDGC